jgi:hypothetical protein
MTTAIRLAILALALVLLLGFGAWYYLFGPNRVSAADLVPADTVIFATIPNAAKITTDYQTSQLKTLLESPNAQPLLDSLRNLVGSKNLDLLQTFLPNLSGQSFFAVTHFDPDHPAQVGLIGALKPKPGLENFDGFIAKLKATYPQILAQGTTGAGQIEGLDYQWIQGPTASDKICVARYRGWIVTAWGEAALQDWWERLQKKSTTPSLTENPAYRMSLLRVGQDAEGVLYLDYHALVAMMQKRIAATNPAGANYLATKWRDIGAIAIGTDFEHGEIADHFSMLIPHATQIDLGASAQPCPFDTLKFTGPDTRFYWGYSLNFEQAWKNLQEQAIPSPATGAWVASLQNWAQSHNLDLERNIIGPLGSEVSIQSEWSSDNTYPEAGFFVKLDKPDDFKPTEAAIIDTVRQMYASSAVINEIESGGQHFATLKFIQSLPISPTITEDGPYFGLFLTENQAVRAFQRDASVGLLNNADFKSQIGDKWNGASQLIFLDSPRLFDRAYQTALPYVSLAAMFNRTLGSLLSGRTLPPDLQWLAPIGTWSFVVSSDDDGIKGYSISGVGNQGIFLTAGMGGGLAAWQILGHPFVAPPALTLPGLAPVLPTPSPAPALVAPAIPPPPPDMTNAPSPPAQPDVTNATPPPTDTTNSPPASPPSSNVPSPAPAPAQ